MKDFVVKNLVLATSILNEDFRLFYDEVDELFFLGKPSNYASFQLFSAEKKGNMIDLVGGIESPLSAGIYDAQSDFLRNLKELKT